MTAPELHRTLRILGYLARPRGVTELSRLIKVSSKTIRRDLDFIRAMGFDLRATVAPRGKKLYRVRGAVATLRKLMVGETQE